MPKIERLRYGDVLGVHRVYLDSAWTKKPFFKKYQQQNDVINIWL